MSSRTTFAFCTLLSTGLVGGCHPPAEPIGDPPFESFVQHPEFGATVTQPTAPPPISGGTLTVLESDPTKSIAVASDPDRDLIYVVDLAAKKLLATLTLRENEEPGRVIEDSHGRVHVILRRGGAVVTLSPTDWKITQRRAVCPTPRGIAADSTLDRIYVACEDGTLATLPGESGDATQVWHLDRDLRDIVVRGDSLYVSRFHSAELLNVRLSDGAITARTKPAATTPSFGDRAGQYFGPEAAWRLAVGPLDGLVYMLHQRAFNGVVVTTQAGGYGGGGDPCAGAIVQSAISQVTPGQTSAPTAFIPQAVLPVDFAFAKGFDEVAVIAAGNPRLAGAPTLILASLRSSATFGNCSPTQSSVIPGEPIAVAYAYGGTTVVQSRQPALLYLPDTQTSIPLSAISKADTGHAVFHANAGADLACASCHLEGSEDGRVWTFENSGARRTQSIRGGIMPTAPFHWDGDQTDFGKLMSEVLVRRMSGPELRDEELSATQHYIDRIPALRSSEPADPAAVERGRGLFADTQRVGCINCHAGTLLTNNLDADVGTGGSFQVPSLRGVVHRAPYLHDGRAATLAERFTALGGGDQHGVTSHLTSNQLADLVVYLETL